MAMRKTAKPAHDARKKRRAVTDKTKSVWERIAQRAQKVPPEADRLPSDLASRADDYLEGRAAY